MKTWDTGNKRLNRMGTTSMFALLQPIMSQSTESLQLIPKTLTENSESPHLIQNNIKGHLELTPYLGIVPLSLLPTSLYDTQHVSCEVPVLMLQISQSPQLKEVHWITDWFNLSDSCLTHDIYLFQQAVSTFATNTSKILMIKYCRCAQVSP